MQTTTQSTFPSMEISKIEMYIFGGKHSIIATSKATYVVGKLPTKNFKA